MNKVTIKYVVKAKKWCKTIKTTVDRHGNQQFKQEWSDEKPSLEIKEEDN